MLPPLAPAEPNGTLDAVLSAPPTAAPLTEPWSVQSVLRSLELSHPRNPETPIPFLHLIERLKTTPREGWRRKHISSGESISDHMYRMSIMTMLAPPSLAKTLDIPRCTKMALVHDMAEALVGDITPVDGINKEEKAKREAETMEYLSCSLLGGWGGGAQGMGIKEIFQEYEDSKTRESVFVHDVDKMELLLQMVEYERRFQGEMDLGEFAWVAKKIALPEMNEWAKEVLRERDEFWKGMGKAAENLGTWKELCD